MRSNQGVILSVVLAFQLGWVSSGCGTAGNDVGTVSSAGASEASTDGGTDGGEESAGNANAGVSAGGTESTGGGSSGAGGIANMGGEGQSAGSAGGDAAGAAGMCAKVMGDYKSCILDHQNRRDAATACTPGAPDQCQEVIMNDCGCQVAVNDAASPEVACYLEALAEGSCSLCTPEPCAQPLGQCEVSDGPTPTCR